MDFMDRVGSIFGAVLVVSLILSIFAIVIVGVASGPSHTVGVSFRGTRTNIMRDVALDNRERELEGYSPIISITRTRDRKVLTLGSLGDSEIPSWRIGLLGAAYTDVIAHPVTDGGE